MCQDLIDFCRLCVCQWRNKEPDRRTKLRRRTLGPPRKQEHSRLNQLEVLVQFIIVPNVYFCVHCLFLCQMLLIFLYQMFISVSTVYFCAKCFKYFRAKCLFMCQMLISVSNAYFCVKCLFPSTLCEVIIIAEVT